MCIPTRHLTQQALGEKLKNVEPLQGSVQFVEREFKQCVAHGGTDSGYSSGARLPRALDLQEYAESDRNSHGVQ